MLKKQIQLDTGYGEVATYEIAGVQLQIEWQDLIGLAAKLKTRALRAKFIIRAVELRAEDIASDAMKQAIPKSEVMIAAENIALRYRSKGSFVYRDFMDGVWSLRSERKQGSIR